ncbi:putative succinate-semialdehyde dehydrogenase [Kockovaella imperatae]|uniref:succinate-semialdehyde dehydrogenase [NAD(P)(+)] n=1 Tax=Kockovaella imperatae TaxID=4999 RepID=A0A1Y1UBB6_9TREE|nr:putative succinate-semialdehyde dehydrogenase [Kockovaella imperatae]ORX34375.1 putative succinate-semialdehyde dehydrogenase [Kockovaella imperatae]
MSRALARCSRALLRPQRQSKVIVNSSCPVKGSSSLVALSKVGPLTWHTGHNVVVSQRRYASNVPKTSSKNPLGLDDPTLLITHGVIGGKSAKAEDGSTFDVEDPATGKTIGTCPDMTRNDTEQAIKVAHDTFQTFKTTTPNDRHGYLLKLYQLILDNRKDLTRLIVWENGKSWTDADAEVTYAAGYIGWFAGEALRTNGETIPCSMPGTRNFTIKQPIGVCSLLVPWNFPAGMIARKMGPVIATGCTAVIKTPAETPYTNLALVELASRAGVPDGVLNVVTTHKHIQEVGEELTTNPLVKKVSFTGSTKVGKMLAKNATDTLKKLSLELGGNAPLIVFEDAHLPTAVAGTIASKFRGSGQTCVCANRIYVHEAIYDEFASALAEKVKAFKVGSGFEDGVTHGPLIHSRQVDKVQQHLDDALSKGAKVLAGGKKLSGNMFQPTVLANVPQDCLITAEETFGPLAALIKFSSEEEVIRLANNAEVGLSGYFFSQDTDRIWRVAEALQVGIVGANTGAISQPVIPFGGVKESGYGKEGGHQGTEEYLVTKYIAVGSKQE